MTHNNHMVQIHGFIPLSSVLEVFLISYLAFLSQKRKTSIFKMTTVGTSGQLFLQ